MKEYILLSLALFATALAQPVGTELNTNYQTWTTVNRLAPWGARHGHSLVVLDSTAYVIAGQQSAVGNASAIFYNDVWRTPLTGANLQGLWTQVHVNQSFPGRYAQGTAVLNNTIILIGGDILNGTVAQSTNDVWASDDGGVTWRQLTANAGWVPRKAHMVGVVNSTIVMVGGLWELPNGTHVHGADIWRSTDGGATWTEVTSNATFGPRADAAMVSYNGSLFLFGGENTPPATFNDVWRSDDAGETWTEVTNNASWPSRFQHEATIINGVFVIAGGHHMNFTDAFNDVWASSDAKNWTRVTEGANWSPRARFGMASLPTNRGVLLVGGQTPTNDTNDVYFAKGPVFVPLVPPSNATTTGTTGSIPLIGSSDSSKAIASIFALTFAMAIALM